MRVSIIIPVYNEEKDIGECLKSLAGQSERSFEIIVVDDGSTDKTSEVLRNFQFPTIRSPKFSNFQYVRQNHNGAGAARNLGAKHANGDVLVFVDADMTFDKEFVKKLVAPIESKKVIGTFSKEEFLANGENVWARCWNINRGLPENRMHNEDHPDTQKVFRAILKGEFERVGGFDETRGYTDDWSLSEKLGVKAVNAPGAVFYHKNPDNLKDIFRQARWMAKRKYKFGIFGGFFKAWLPIKFSLPFFIFKIVFGLGSSFGVVEHYFFRRVSK